MYKNTYLKVYVIIILYIYLQQSSENVNNDLK